jgi:CHAT domain-containing protein
LTTYELPAAPQIESAARRLYQLLTARQVLDATQSKKHQTPAEMDRAYWEQAEALSATILGPVASQLGHQRLIIVAGGALQYVPFAALPVPGVRSPGGVWTPLMIDHEILSLPSMSVLAELRAQIADRKPRQGKALAVLADPVFSADDQRVRKKAVRKSGQVEPAPPQFVRATRDLIDDTGRVSRLPFTRREAQRISAFAPDATVSLDFEANRAAAMNPELGNHRIVHFATHGILNSENPELSGIVLSLVDAEGKAQNGFLGLRDLYNLKFPADLVVLSACQTGLGRDVKGEGLVGLTRGFMYAGAARIVASLWKVNDLATSELMARFYESMLANGLEPAQALRFAQKSMWQSKRWRSPYYWAAFLIQGEWKKTNSNISASEPHPR